MTDNERIAILETKMQQLHGDFADIKTSNKEILKTLGDMNNVFMQARGARWAFLAMAAVGGFVSAKLVPILQGLGLIR